MSAPDPTAILHTPPLRGNHHPVASECAIRRDQQSPRPTASKQEAPKAVAASRVEGNTAGLVVLARPKADPAPEARRHALAWNQPAAGGSPGGPFVFEQVQNQPDHEVLLPRVAFGDEQRERDERVVAEPERAVRALQHAVAAQVLQEQQRADPLVPVGERVVLDEEVEEVGRAGLYARVERLAAEGLRNRVPSFELTR
jgi:hypothetical protein